MPWADSGLGSPPTAGVTIGRGFSHGWAHFDFGGIPGQADQRADLDLHVSLLAEHEITRLIALVAAMAKHMGVDEANTAELVELQKDVRPESVMREIQKEEGKMESQKHKQAEP